MFNKIKFAFFGSSEFSIFVLNELEKNNILPDIIITVPDKPKGRKMELSPTPVKIWADTKKIDCLTPAKLDEDFLNNIKSRNIDVFLVASYGKIIPESVFNLPKYKTLNIHPSLLPEFRGATPVQNTILQNKNKTGVSIIQIDALMDHGPIIIQEEVVIQNWPINTLELKRILGELGANLFIKIIPDWMNGKIIPKIQDESKTTFTKKIQKIDGEININDNNDLEKLLKTKAYSIWPNTFYFDEIKGKKTRIIIKDAKLDENGKFLPTIVIPEGKKEMSYEDFLRGKL